MPAVLASVANDLIDFGVKQLLQVIGARPGDLRVSPVPSLQDHLVRAWLHLSRLMLREYIAAASRVQAREDQRAALTRPHTRPTARKARLAPLRLAQVRQVQQKRADPIVAASLVRAIRMDAVIGARQVLQHLLADTSSGLNNFSSVRAKQGWRVRNRETGMSGHPKNVQSNFFFARYAREISRVVHTR